MQQLFLRARALAVAMAGFTRIAAGSRIEGGYRVWARLPIGGPA